MTEEDMKHLKSIRSHIENVQRYMYKLADELLETDDAPFYLSIVGSAQIHDYSKLRGIEFTYLRPSVKESNPDLFYAALKSHWVNNDHHPEHFLNGVKDMSEINLAEMVCDWRARSSEMGTDFLDWVKNAACDKYDISKQGRQWPIIKKYSELILEDKFK